RVDTAGIGVPAASICCEICRSRYSSSEIKDVRKKVYPAIEEADMDPDDYVKTSKKPYIVRQAMKPSSIIL
uniref:Uncharacterized protein n=1 Tax=Oryza brachyantha TaxID=4533 RepID=J3N1P9_ORYBR